MSEELDARTATAVAEEPIGVAAQTGTLLASAATLPVLYDTWKHGLEWAQHDTRAVRRPLPKYRGATPQCPPDLDHCRTAKVLPGVEQAWATRITFADGCDVSDITDWPAHVRATLDADTGSQLAAYLWSGVSGRTTAPADFVSPTQTFTGNVDVVDGTARHPVRAFAALTGAMRAGGYRGRLWFHVNDAALSHLLENGIVERSGALYRHGDHVVVLDPGYPTDITGQTASAAGEAWMVATGRVEVGVGPIEVVDPTDASCADPTWEASRLAIARFTGTPTTGRVKAARIRLWEP